MKVSNEQKQKMAQALGEILLDTCGQEIFAAYKTMEQFVKDKGVVLDDQCGKCGVNHQLMGLVHALFAVGYVDGLIKGMDSQVEKITKAEADLLTKAAKREFDD